MTYTSAFFKKGARLMITTTGVQSHEAMFDHLVGEALKAARQATIAGSGRAA
jgi:hypothetical protein